MADRLVNVSDRRPHNFVATNTATVIPLRSFGVGFPGDHAPQSGIPRVTLPSFRPSTTRGDPESLARKELNCLGGLEGEGNNR